MALAYVLHDLHKQQAVAVGLRHLSPESLAHFCAWADRIVIMQAVFKDRIPQQFHAKLRTVDVGEDRWGIYVHPELLAFLTGVGNDWAKREFQI